MITGVSIFMLYINVTWWGGCVPTSLVMKVIIMCATVSLQKWRSLKDDRYLNKSKYNMVHKSFLT